MSLKIKKIQGFQFFRLIAGFSIVGIVITLFSIALLFFLLEVLSLNVFLAYTLSYLISIALSWFLNGKLVFKSQLNIKNYLLYYGIYLSGMVLGLGIIALTRVLFNFGEFINSLCATPFTMTWNFIGVHFIFNKYSTNPSLKNL